MAQQSILFKWAKNDDLVISPQELKNRYLFGIPVVDSDGNNMPDEDIKFYIRAAQTEIENFLSIKINKQVYKESRDFNFDDWLSWGYTSTTYMVNKPLSLQGFLNTTLQIDYPPEWLSAKKTSDNILFHRTVNLVPIHGSANSLSNNVVYVGIAPYIGYFGNKQIPNYWEIKYITGWDNTPADIVNIIGKLASINIFHILGDIILGAGIASKSISIDGLSQTVTTTQSAENAGYSARIKAYLQDIKLAAPTLRLFYKRITFGSV